MSVSRDEVMMAYRLLLGREPESEEVIRDHTKSDSLQALRERFMRSAEFRKKSTREQAQQSFLPQDLPAMDVDVDASDDQMDAVMSKIQLAWEHLGSQRPHFSVLTDPQFLPENLEGTIGTFWESGEAEAARAQLILERHGLTSLRDKVCVEFGCGVGRVSMGLARSFAKVHGYDISSWHLAHAEQRGREIGLTNLELHRYTDINEDIRKCDVFYSRIVLQHNPPPIIVQLISNAFRSLNPGGIAIFQVPTYAKEYRFNTIEWLNTEHVMDMQMHCLPQYRIFELIEAEGCLPLEVREDNATGKPESFISNTFIVRKRTEGSIRRLLRHLLRPR
jgi:2-polyprenyl-3-methyl-5-hydroxy-6-metoxy-1,4-benzoquinol methylase